MRNTYLSRSALKAALLPFFPAGRAGTALLPLRLSVVAAVLFHGFVPSLFGQADSRAEEIQREREANKSQQKAETMNRAEKFIYEIEAKRLLRRLSSGWNGFRVKIGGMPAGGGFAVGPEYHRDELLSGNLAFRTSAELSTKVYQ